MLPYDTLEVSGPGVHNQTVGGYQEICGDARHTVGQLEGHIAGIVQVSPDDSVLRARLLPPFLRVFAETDYIETVSELLVYGLEFRYRPQARPRVPPPISANSPSTNLSPGLTLFSTERYWYISFPSGQSLYPSDNIPYRSSAFPRKAPYLSG